MCLLQSFKDVKNGEIELHSGLTVPTLKSLQVLSISQYGREISEETMSELIKYGSNSKKFIEFQ